MCYRTLCERMKSNDEEVGVVKVFSAIANHFPDSARRHELYNRALRIRGVKPILGEFKDIPESCKPPKGCGRTWTGHEEKESDVNIALHVLDDLHQGLVDVVYLVTNDTDQVPP